MTILLAVSLTVPDLDAAIRFYGEALGFAEESDKARCPDTYARTLGAPGAVVWRSRLRLGAQRLELLAFDPPGRPYPADSTSSDLWFQHCAIAVGDIDAAVAHLEGCATRPITQGGPQTLPPNTGSVRAYKFRDPYGHPLELLQFPEGVGDPGWQRPAQPLFRGIDHTAIAVSDTAIGTDFYERRLGLRVTSQTHNRGPEQSRLDAIPDADVKVVGLSPATEPPHLELLAYRTGSRRPRPPAWEPSDAAITRTIFGDTSGPSSCQTGSRAEFSCRMESDPDGHILMFD